MLPIVIFIELLFLSGLALALSAINVYYRDVQHILGNLMTLWFFLCPILYPVENVPQKLRFTLLLNPVATMTQMYQQIFISAEFPSIKAMMFAFSVSCLMLFVGSLIFNRYREGFAELI